MRQHYLVSYDVCDPARLRRVHRTVRDFGRSLQYSVFTCHLSPIGLATLEARLREVICTTSDRILFVRLGDSVTGGELPPRCRTIGRPLSKPRPKTMIA